MELLEIEKELAGENRDAALKRYDEMLVALDARRQEALRKGVPPGEFTRVEELGEVVTLARKLLRLQMKVER